MAQASGFYDLGTAMDRELISSSAEQLVVMGFVEDTLYVEAAWESLQRKCPRGAIDGITVESSTQLGFFQWTNRIHMRGVCVNRPPPAEAVPETGVTLDPATIDPT